MHEDFVPLEVDSVKALERARAVMITAGLSVTSSGHGELDLKGPGMSSSHETGLLAITEGRLSVGGGRVELKAELGGLKRLQRFVVIFPAALCLGLFVIFYLAGLYARNPWAVAGTTLGNAALWLILGPWMAGRFRRKVESDIHRALTGIAAE